MGRGVVPFADVAPVFGPVAHRLHHVAHLDEIFVDGAEELQAGHELRRRVSRLNRGGHKREVLALGAHVVRKRAPKHVHVALPPRLLLRDDDLDTVRVGYVGNWVAQDADGADHLSDPANLAREVARVSNHELRLCRLALGRHAARLARLVVHHLRVGLGEHVRTSVHGGETREPLGQLAEAVEGVDVRAARVEPGEGLGVELDRHHHLPCGLVHERLVRLERERVADEVHGVRVQAVFFEELPRGDDVQIVSLVGPRIVLVVILDEDEEPSGAVLLEHAHEGRPERILIRRGHLVRLATLAHVASVHSLELEVLVHAGVDQQAHEEPVAHHELGDHVEVPVLPPAVVRRQLLAGLELLVQLLQVEARGLAAVVRVAVHVEDLLPVHGEEAREEALLQARAQDDGVVLLIHGSLRSLCERRRRSGRAK